MKRLLLSLLTLLGFSVTGKADPPATQVVKISVFMSGELHLNGKPSFLNEIREELTRLKGSAAEVWYYREAATEDPPQISYEILDLVTAARLPVSFSTKPDFSDYVDGETGESISRKKR